MSARDYISGAQFPPPNYRSAYGRAQEIGKNMPAVTTDAPAEYVSARSERRQMIRHLSRSSISGEHLSGLAGIHTASLQTGPTSAMYDNDTHVAHLGWSPSYDDRSRTERGETQHGVLHELGHHNMSRVQRFAGTEGSGEALAENFAEKHRTAKLPYHPSSYDASYKGDRSHDAVSYRKTRKSGELPSGHGKVI